MGSPRAAFSPRFQVWSNRVPSRGEAVSMAPLQGMHKKPFKSIPAVQS